MAVELATAYVSLVPSAKGLGRAASREIGRELSGPMRATDQLSGSLGKARTGAFALVGAIAAVGAGATLRGLYSAATAASDFVESQSKATQVFKASAGEIERFADRSATSVGLSSQAATEAAGTFGNLFTSMGIGRSEAAGMSTEMVQLGADLASFNNIPVADALEKIRAGLVGEQEPLRALGISFNAAQVEAKAMQLGLADASGEVSEAAKVQARLAIISEQASNASGDFARTSDGLANQQRILRAEFDNQVATLGRGLLPSMLDLVATSREALPGLADLAEAGVEVLVASFDALLPLMGTGTNLLVALAPAISAVASVIDAIPAPVLQIAAGFALFNRVGGPSVRLLSQMATPAGAVSGAFASGATNAGRFGGAVAGVKSILTPTNVALGAAVVAFTLWSDAQAKARESQRNIERQTETFSTALQGAEGAVEGYATALQDAVKAGEEFSFTLEPSGRGTAKYRDVLDKAGLSVEQFARLVLQGDGAVDRFTARLLESREAKITDTAALTDLSEQMQSGARRALDAGVAVGDYTKSQVNSALAATAAKDGSRNYAAALDELKTTVDAETASQEANAEAVAASNVELSKAVQAAPGLAAELRALRVPGGDVRREFSELAVSLSDADLSADQFSAVADRLGVDLPELQAHVEEVDGVISDLQSTASGAVPGIEGIASQVEDLSSLTAPKLTDTLSGMYDNLLSFNDNLRLVFEERPALAPLAAQAPEMAALISGAIREGKAGALAEWELLVAGIGQQQGRTIDVIGAHSPELVAVLEEQGLLATGALAANYRPDTVARTRTEAARINIQNAKDGITEAARVTGEGGTSGFRAGSSPIPGTGRDRMEQARRNIVNAKEPMLSAGRGSGEAGSRGFASGTSPIPGGASARMEAARERIAASKDQMSGAGGTAGLGVRDGFLSGMATPRSSINTVVQGMRDNIVGAMRDIFDMHSPSRVMIPLGRNVTEGFVRGVLENKKWVQKTLRSFGSEIFGMFAASIPSGGGGAGVQQWMSTALAALAYTGQSAGYLGDLLAQMQHESGGNPKAINLWDSNAAKGTPSMGLMQTIGPTFAAFAKELAGRGIFDPFANIVAAIRYTLSRYGDLGAWRRRGFKGYARGAYEVGPMGGYTHPGEMVLSRQMASMVRALPGGPGGHAGTAVNIENANFFDGVDVDLFTSRLEFEVAGGRL